MRRIEQAEMKFQREATGYRLSGITYSQDIREEFGIFYSITKITRQ
jgi:hypothetical protein